MSRIGTNFEISGKIVKDNDTYLVKDNTQLNSTIVSTTELYPGKATRGHSHDDQEEVYVFTEGHGEMYNALQGIRESKVIKINENTLKRIVERVITEQK